MNTIKNMKFIFRGSQGSKARIRCLMKMCGVPENIHLDIPILSFLINTDVLQGKNQNDQHQNNSSELKKYSRIII